MDTTEARLTTPKPTVGIDRNSLAGIATIGSRPSTPMNTDVGAGVFVWSIWTLLLLAALAFVGRYGSDLPCSDDFELVPALTGHQPDIVSWLWSEFNNHRLPFPKLVLLVLGRLTGCDFRAG